MKLLLTSSGLSNKKVLDFFISLLPREPRNCSALMVAYVQNEEEQSYVDISKKELVDCGIGTIATFNLKEKKFDDRKMYDSIYVCGGNTFAILHRMRVTGIDIFIKKVIGQEKSLYCGVSAGSIIAGPSIEIAGWGSEGDTNEINLEDLTGFHFTDIAVSPHFKSYLQQEVENFKNKVTYPIIALTDGEALFVQDTHYTIIK